MPTLLVVDDDALIADTFRALFAGGDVTLHLAATAEAGLEAYRRIRPDVVLTDVRLPDKSGLELFKGVREIDPKALVILMTGFGTAGTAIEAMRLGAVDYLPKPFDPDALLELLNRAFEIRRLMTVPAVVNSAADAEPGAADVLIGRSAAMQEVYKTIGRAAPQEVTVLVLGESGTGKELVARAIYHYGSRAAGPFLSVSCAAVPEPALEAELFGHEGVAPGTDRRRVGKLEQCNGGTLFLDEIGDLTPAMQAKLLRVVQDGTFERVGGTEPVRVDVRLVVASARDLSDLMARGLFRGDLFYRLNVCVIRLPPLRERQQDLPLLVEHFVRRFGPPLGRSIAQIAPATIERMSRYPWPGNVRELQSAVKQALLMATGSTLLPEFLPDAIRGAAPVATPATDAGFSPADGPFPLLTRFIRERILAATGNLYSEVLDVVERQMLTEVLRATEGNISHAARMMGISRPTLRSKMHGLGMSIERTAVLEE